MGLILCAAQIIGIMISVGGIVVLIQKEQNRTTLFLMMADIGCLLINSCYLLLFRSKSASEALVALKVQYLGNVLCYTCLALFILEYLRLKKAKLVMIVWAILDLANLLCLWNEKLIYLVYRDLRFTMVENLGVLRMDMSLGLLQIMRCGLISAFFFCSAIYMFVRMLRTKAELERRNMGRLIGTQFVILLALNFTILTHYSYDVMPICASICILTIITGVIRGELLNVVETGREWVVENMGNAFLVVDPMYGYLDANSEAKSMFPQLSVLMRNGAVGEEVYRIFMYPEDIVQIGERYYEKSVQPIEQDGKVVGFGLLLMDVTERQLLLEEVQAAKQRAEEANEAKSAFMSNMSHEIRTPMNAIVGMTEILLRGKLPEQEREYLYNIRNSGNALLSIINDILDFSKIESGRLEIVEDDYEPMSMLNDVSMIFLNRIGEKKIELLYDIDVDLPMTLHGDALRIRQIIINLMNNAIKFTEEGYVKLSVKSVPVNGDEVELHFSVEDSGQGIRKEDLPKLFGMYRQVDTKKNHHKEGTGLGLSISKNLVDLMGGEFRVESEYGVGSNFMFFIPQKVRSAKKAAAVREKAQTVTVGGRFRSTYLEETLTKLAGQYGIALVPKEKLAAERVDYFFTDCKNLVTPEEERRLHGKGTQFYLLHNPMIEKELESGMTVLNKPLYSLNFSQIINGESVGVSTNNSEVMQFKAPKAKILIVDDNEMNLKVAVGLLEPLQMQIDLAENGKNALAKIKEKEYDVVFMDHMMPVMDGVEATRQLRAMEGDYFQKLPVIALTANVISEAKESFREAGMNDFAAKPIKLKEITAILRKWIPAEYIEETDESESVRPEPVEELPPIEGLDVAEGVRNSGTAKLFYSLLGDFYRLTDMKAEKIEKCLADGLLRDYTIEVHALKNTARMIGALELSEEFFELEKLGNAEERAVLEEKTPDVLAHYRSYKPILKPYAAAAEEEKQEVSTQVMAETLQKLSDAMDQFDLDGADAAVAELESFRWPEGLQSHMERLRALVADVAMEDVLETVKTMKDMLLHD